MTFAFYLQWGLFSLRKLQEAGYMGKMCCWALLEFSLAEWGGMNESMVILSKYLFTQRQTIHFFKK